MNLYPDLIYDSRCCIARILKFCCLCFFIFACPVESGESAEESINDLLRRRDAIDAQIVEATKGLPDTHEGDVLSGALALKLREARFAELLVERALATRRSESQLLMITIVAHLVLDGQILTMTVIRRLLDKVAVFGQDSRDMIYCVALMHDLSIGDEFPAWRKRMGWGEAIDENGVRSDIEQLVGTVKKSENTSASPVLFFRVKGLLLERNQPSPPSEGRRRVVIPPCIK